MTSTSTQPEIGVRSRAHLPLRPGLDGVRGLAVTAVVIDHMWPSALPGGFLGVDVFFVLSGYLITSLLLAELVGHGAVRLRSFWARRARRLLPALYLLLIGVALAVHLLPGWQRPSIRGDGFAALAYVSNWRFIVDGQQYFSSTGAPSPLLHLWSLGIEEQTYLIWPLVVLAVWRVGRHRLTTVGWVALAGALGSALAMVAVGPGTTAYFASYTRAQAILLGAAAAVAFPIGGDGKSRSRSRAGAVSAAGVAGLGVLVLLGFVATGTDAWMYRGGFTLAAVAAVALTVSAASGGVVARAFSLGPLRLLGRVSYGLYLIHWPVIVFCTPGRMHLHGFALDAVRLALMAVLTTASYHFVEQPVRRGRLSAASARWATPLAVSLAAVAVIGMGLGAAPVPAYLRSSGSAFAGAATSLPPPRRSAAPVRKPRPQAAHAVAPTTTVPVAPLTRITLVGDSVAASLYPGLEAAAAAHGVQLINRTAPGCGIVTNSVPANPDGTAISFVSACRAAIGQIQAAAAGDHSGLVVLLSTWEAGDRLAGAVHLVPRTAAWRSSIDSGLAAAVARVSAGGSRVMLLGEAPIVDGLSRDIDATTRAENEALVSLEAQFAAAHHIAWIDLGGIVCGGDEARCPVELDGVRLRPVDGAHFSTAGADAVGPALFQSILAAASR